ncbi:MAG: NrtA/SsuA/CpmA family ABC transporter substrate-binding protein [Desulfobulbaceae bacterium]|nr:NrtA/SsuA/CpmA family ABC transporter substrate-binding protein [Desulfobulbaceae bacterium]
MIKKNYLLLIGLAAIVLFMILAFRYLKLSSRGQEADQEIKPPETAILACVDTTAAGLIGIALRNGYFEREELEIDARSHDYGKTALESMLNGDADFATVADSPIMIAIMAGDKIYILATIQSATINNSIITLNDSGIRDPGDLRGKRIAATFGTTSESFLDAFLIANEIAGHEVQKINLEPLELHDALVNRRVDAVSAFQPYNIKLQDALGKQAVAFYDKNIYTSSFNIVARQEFVHENPEKVKRLLRALIRAEDFARKNPAQAQKIIAGYCGMSVSSIEAIWPDMHYRVSLDQSLILSLEDKSEWAVNNDIVKWQVTPNYLDYIYFKGLESVNPAAVRIYR